MKISKSLWSVMISILFYLTSAPPFVICSSLEVTIDNHSPSNLKTKGSLEQDKVLLLAFYGFVIVSCFFNNKNLYITLFSSFIYYNTIHFTFFTTIILNLHIFILNLYGS